MPDFRNSVGGLERFDASGRSQIAGTVTDSTGTYVFDLDSLPRTPTWDAAGNLTSITYGPDRDGRSIKRTRTWLNGVWMGDTAWVLV